MARGALKGLKRNRPTPGEKVVVKGQLAQGTGGRSPAPSVVSTPANGNAVSSNGSSELDGGELVGWLNCECFFSLVLVGLLAALPFNIHTQELMQTPETYVARAIELKGEGAFDKAAALYERAVNAEETPERHALLADALVKAERRDEALWHYEQAADLYEDRQNKVSTLERLGEVQTKEGLPEDAVKTYLQVLELQGDDVPQEVAKARYQVATSLLDSSRHSQAVEQLELAAGIAPEVTEAQELLAHTLRDMGLLEEAVRRYKNMTSQRNTDVGILVQLGFAYHELCDFSQALALYKKARSAPARAIEMDYLTAALHSKSFRPPRAPAAYVSDVFDLEARKSAFMQSKLEMVLGASRVNSDGDDESPEAVIEKTRSSSDGGLFYDVHGLIMDSVAPNMTLMIEAALGLPDSREGGRISGQVSEGGKMSLKWLDILDLGCGRGRMGLELQSLANHMTGVDLSKEAIKHALRTKAYDNINHGEALAVTKSMLPQSMDLVVAADLVPYFGDLAELLRAIETVTRPGGLVAFNADLMDRDDDASGAGSSSASGRAYELRFTGRWSHRRKYVTQTVAAAGLSVLGVRVVTGHTRLISPAAGNIVLEAIPQERQSTIFLCGKGVVATQ